MTGKRIQQRAAAEREREMQRKTRERGMQRETDEPADRFFFPWPHMPQQQYDENTERVAGMRRLEDDDQWLNPHNLYLAMFSPSTVHCLPFDPRHGADTARQYAGKYASKPEKWYLFFFQRESQ